MEWDSVDCSSLWSHGPWSSSQCPSPSASASRLCRNTREPSYFDWVDCSMGDPEDQVISYMCILNVYTAGRVMWSIFGFALHCRHFLRTAMYRIISEGGFTYNHLRRATPGGNQFCVSSFMHYDHTTHMYQTLQLAISIIVYSWKIVPKEIDLVFSSIHTYLVGVSKLSTYFSYLVDIFLQN